jgi:hypothetical protein
MTASLRSDSTFRARADQPETPTQRAAAFAEKLAALVPAEALLLYGFVLAAATETGDDGTQTITNANLLKWSVPIIAAFAIVLFLIGKWRTKEKADWLRAFIPAGAFLAWVLLTGATAITLWDAFSSLSGGWEFLVGGVVGGLMLALSAAVAPKT